MKMDASKILKNDELKQVTGGTGSTDIQGIIGMDHFETEQKTCPKCGGNKLSYRNFIADDGKTSKIGQLCECGYSWTFGNKTSIV